MAKLSPEVLRNSNAYIYGRRHGILIGILASAAVVLFFRLIQ